MRRHRLRLRARALVNSAVESPDKTVVHGEEYALALQARSKPQSAGSGDSDTCSLG